MRLKSLRRINENIYEAIYINFWGVYRKIKVYKSFFDWRELEKGKVIDNNIQKSLDALSYKLEIGKSITTSIK